MGRPIDGTVRYTFYLVIIVCTLDSLGGRWQEGAAFGAGEDMEQLFSYLSRFNNTTKCMTASHAELLNNII